jgi:hypothetical protein
MNFKGLRGVSMSFKGFRKFQWVSKEHVYLGFSQVELDGAIQNSFLMG